MAKVVVKSKVKKVKRKYPVEVRAPDFLNAYVLGRSDVTDLSTMVGKGAKVNLMYITGNAKNQNIRLGFRVTDVKSGLATTEVTSYEQIPYYLGRFVKKGSDLLEDSFTAKTKDEKLLFHAIKLNDLIREAIKIATPVWRDGPEAKGISVEIIESCAEEELIVLGNETDLREAIINMIFNSVDALSQGGEIHISTYAKDESICLDLSDNGIGMTEETKKRIFDPFFTTKGANHSGLGMSMLYGMIKRHNGSIDIKTSPGKGTMFTIVLPKGKANIEKKREDPNHATKAVITNILIIDDQPDVCEVLSEILSSQGHHTSAFNSGTDGIEEFRNGDYEILITDIGMPDMSGWEVIDIVRKIKPGVIIGVVTGGDISEKEAKQRGVDFLINKPFESNEIVQAIANAVN